MKIVLVFSSPMPAEKETFRRDPGTSPTKREDTTGIGIRPENIEKNISNTATVRHGSSANQVSVTNVSEILVVEVKWAGLPKFLPFFPYILSPMWRYQ